MNLPCEYVCCVGSPSKPCPALPCHALPFHAICTASPLKAVASFSHRYLLDGPARHSPQAQCRPVQTSLIPPTTSANTARPDLRSSALSNERSSPSHTDCRRNFIKVSNYIIIRILQHQSALAPAHKPSSAINSFPQHRPFDAPPTRLIVTQHIPPICHNFTCLLPHH